MKYFKLLVIENLMTRAGLNKELSVSTYSRQKFRKYFWCDFVLFFVFISWGLLVFAEEDKVVAGSSVGVSAKPNLVQGSLTVVTPMLDLTFDPEIDPLKALNPRGIPTADTIINPNDILTNDALTYAPTLNRANLTEVLNTLENLAPVTNDEKLLASITSDPVLHRDYWARNVRFTRDIWCLQFSFKPLRVINIDVPNKNGMLDKKTVWYLVYNVKNMGPADIASVVKTQKITSGDQTSTLTSTEYTIKKHGSIGTGVDKPTDRPQIADVEKKSNYAADETFNITGDTYAELQNLKGTYVPRNGEDRAIRFIPQFILASDRVVLNTFSEVDSATGKAVFKTEEERQVYVDRFLPLAIPAIMRREGMKAVPENSVSISNKQIKSNEDYWGIAMWVDVDPRINKFSVYVSGLTNAYKWEDVDPKNVTPGQGRKMERKVLKTNWWRKGDKYSIDNDQFQTGQTGGVDYEWIFL
ncbi:MAG: hypothetical protein LBJ00_16360 [Planctomycetaceae bacterium]|jgi:hypothetical protein|nr:hypothetical protein [Planctomycetaceae bacterium]